MVNRLALNLIQGADQREDSVFRTRTGMEPPAFATGSFLGNIGGPLRTVSDDEYDDTLEEFEDEAKQICSCDDKTVTTPSTDGSEEFFIGGGIELIRGNADGNV